MDRIVTACEISGCNDTAQYKCPRCRVRFCTVGCFRRHSDDCVVQFDRDATSQLHGQKVSDEERRLFHAFLKRFKCDEEYNDDNGEVEADNLDDVLGRNRWWDSESGDEVEDRGSGSDGESDDMVEGDEEEREEVGKLLTQLVEQLDDAGRDAMFAKVHKAMDHDFREKQRNGSTGTKFGTDDDDANIPRHVEQDSAIEAGENVPRSDVRERMRKSGVHMDKYAEEMQQLFDIMDDMENGNMTMEEALSKLPPELADDFEGRLRDGRLDDLVQRWTPWWSKDIPDDSDNASKEHDRDAVIIQALLPRLPTERELGVSVGAARRRASPTLVNSVVDVVMAYCFIMRRMNGDWRHDPITAARALWEASGVTSSDERHVSVKDAVLSVARRIDALFKSRHDVESAFGAAGIAAAEDASVLLGGASDWVVRAVFDCAMLLAHAAEEIGERTRRKEIRLRLRKMYFFAAWSMGEATESFIEAARVTAGVAGNPAWELKGSSGLSGLKTTLSSIAKIGGQTIC